MTLACLILAIATQHETAYEVAPGIYRASRATGFAHYGEDLYFGIKDGNLYDLSLWNLPRSRIQDIQLGSFDRMFSYLYGIGSMSVSPDGKWLAAADSTGDEINDVLLFALGREPVPRFFGLVGMWGRLVFEADSKHALSVGYDESEDDVKQLEPTRYTLETGKASDVNDSALRDAARTVGIGALGRYGSNYLYPRWNAASQSVDLVGYPDGKTHGSLPRSSALCRRVESGGYSSWAGLRAAVRSGDRKTIDVFSLVDGSLKSTITVPYGVWYQELWMLSEKLILTNSEIGTQIWNVDEVRPVLTINIFFDGMHSWILMWDDKGRYYAEPELPSRLTLPQQATTQDVGAIEVVLKGLLAGMTEPRLQDDVWLPLSDVLPK